MASLELKIANVQCPGSNPDSLLAEPIPVTLYRRFSSQGSYVADPVIEVVCPFLRKHSASGLDEAFFCLASVSSGQARAQMNGQFIFADRNDPVMTRQIISQSLLPCIQKQPL